MIPQDKKIKKVVIWYSSSIYRIEFFDKDGNSIVSIGEKDDDDSNDEVVLEDEECIIGF